MPRPVGNVEKLPSGMYRARVTVGERADGSRRQDTKTFDSERVAELWCYTHAAEMGAHPEGLAGVTLKTLWELYKDERGEQLAKTTLETYTWHMSARVLPELGEMDITAITHADIQRVLSTMTHSTASKARTALSAVLSYGVKTNLLSENVMRRADFKIPEPKTLDIDDDAWDDDPFAAIEGELEVWDDKTVFSCFDLIRGLPLEPVWLACVGAGLRVEEAMALRPADVRRVKIEDVEVTQLAIHHATTRVEDRRKTKTQKSVRVVTMLEPFGTRYIELCDGVERKKPVCKASASRQNKAWRSYFEPPKIHKRMSPARVVRGRLQELPYIPLSKMRNTHATLLQQAGVMDSMNSWMHGNSEKVIYEHYLRPDTTKVTINASNKIRLNLVS